MSMTNGMCLIICVPIQLIKSPAYVSGYNRLLRSLLYPISESDVLSDYSVCEYTVKVYLYAWGMKNDAHNIEINYYDELITRINEAVKRFRVNLLQLNIAEARPRSKTDSLAASRC